MAPFACDTTRFHRGFSSFWPFSSTPKNEKSSFTNSSDRYDAAELAQWNVAYASTAFDRF